MGQAHLDTQRIWLEVRRSLTDAVFETVRVELAQTRRRADYAQTLAALLDEVISELDLPLRLEIDRRDSALIDQILTGYGEEITVTESLETWGGLIGHRPDGRVSIDNTLETRAVQAESLFRGKVADLLTGEKHDDG